MTALKRLFVPLDRHDTPATHVKHAIALAKALGTKLHLLSVSHDCHGDKVTEDVRGIDPSLTAAGSPSHSETGAPGGERRRTMPRPCTLDALAEELAAGEGVRLLDLEPLTTVVVRTSHSVYRLIVLHGSTILLRGGAFPDDTIGQLLGSGFGGHLLKLGWIGVGLRMEILAGGKRFITSAVRAITTEGTFSKSQPQ